MRLTALIFFFSLLAVSGAARAEAAKFFQELSDVPLMPGMVELEGSGMVFDKPEGRIVQAAAAGHGVSEPQIRRFYDQALPQFGWKKSDAAVFVRNNEKLQLDIPLQNGQPILQITVEPR
jgi:hypothetical protein